LQPQEPLAPSPLELVKLMAKAEADAVPFKKHFLYRRREKSTRTKGHTWEELVVEIPAGRMRRLVSIDGQPLSPSQKQAELNRIQYLTQHPEDIGRDNQNRKEDESKTTELLRLLPKVFLFDMDGTEDGCTRIKFRPNPAYQEQSFEERIIHAMSGSLLVHPGDNRLCRLDAHLSYQVQFAYGLLGKVSQGSGFYMDRVQVMPGQWKTDKMLVHVDGNIFMLKSVSREEDSLHFGFQEVPYDMTIPQSADLVRKTSF